MDPLAGVTGAAAMVRARGPARMRAAGEAAIAGHHPLIASRPMPVEALVAVIVATTGMLVALALVIRRARVRVPPGGALVIYAGGREPTVTFSDATVIPLLARAEPVDLSARMITIAREGRDALRCADDIKVDIRAQARLAVNPTAEDVVRVTRAVGARAADPALLHELFEAKIADAIATTVRMLSFDELCRDRELLRDRSLEVVGCDLGGWVLQELAFVRIEQVPLELLDPTNIHDAEAIRRIRERLAAAARER